MMSADAALTENEILTLDETLDGMEMSEVFGGSKITKK